MALNFKALQDEVLNHGFDEAYRSRVKIWLNEAIQKIGRSIMMPSLTETFTVSQTSGTSTVAMPTNLVRIINVFDPTNTRQLVPTPFVDMQSYTERSGDPLSYAIDEASGSLLLYPTPTSQNSLVIRYYAAPDELSADSDAPAIPSAYQDLILTYALSRAFRAEDDYEAAAKFHQDFLEDLARAQTDLQYRDTHSRQVPGTWAG